MRKLIFLASLIAISLTLSSCKITQEGLWGVDLYKEDFKEIAISDDGKGVILVGKKYHYFLDDESNVMKRIVNSSVISRIEVLPNDRFFVDKSGNRIEFNFVIVSVNANLLSNEERKVFKNLKFSEPNNNGLDIYNYRKFYKSLRLQGIRYLPTPKDTYKTYPLNFAKPFNRKIEEEPTPLKTTGKILLTPLAVAADILMAPLYLIGALAH